MPHLLQDQYISLQLDLPLEGYQQSRFDWTGKITRVDYDGIPIAGHELPEGVSPKHGQGFYNEFGMASPLGFEEAQEGEWFHKIGVGLLKKYGRTYDFQKSYEIQPAQFEVHDKVDHIIINCQGVPNLGYAYQLEKTIHLLDDGFAIHYNLKNRGEKPIITSEYVHNFITIDKGLISSDYHLDFPFEIDPSGFGETVNPEQLVRITPRGFNFLGGPTEQFFFSNLSGNEKVSAHWTLTHTGRQIGISETGDFSTAAINLWGWGHVISPELFMDICLAPGKYASWTRTYRIFRP